jgi:hypothetical protein
MEFDHEIEIDGEKKTVKLNSDNFDHKALGLVQGDQVDSIRSTSYQDGLKKGAAEAETLKKELEDAKAKIEAAKSKGGSTTLEIEELRQSVAAMQKETLEARAEATRNKFRADITSLSTKHTLNSDGAEVLELFAQKALRKREDGTVEYMLPDNTLGSLESFADQWVAQKGKAYQPSAHLGGNGTGGDPAPAPGGEIETSEQKAAYIEKNGMDAFKKKALEKSKKKLETRLSNRT